LTTTKRGRATPIRAALAPTEPTCAEEWAERLNSTMVSIGGTEKALADCTADDRRQAIAGLENEIRVASRKLALVRRLDSTLSE
jgi:hypothetical protein